MGGEHCSGVGEACSRDKGDHDPDPELGCSGWLPAQDVCPWEDDSLTPTWL